MKNVNDIIEEVLIESDASKILTTKKSNIEKLFPLITSYNIKNIKLSIYDDNHAIKRFGERFPKLNIKDYKNVLKNGIKKIYTKHNCNKGFYWIISKSTGIVIPLKLYIDEDDVINSMIGTIDSTYMSTYHLDTYNVFGRQFSLKDNTITKIKVESKNIYNKLLNEDSISEWIEYGDEGCIELKHYFENKIHTTNGIIIKVL